MTLVPRNRPTRHPMVRCGLRMLMAHDPPRYTRSQIAAKAKHLRWKLRGIDPKRNEFVRYMVQWWGEKYIGMYR